MPIIDVHGKGVNISTAEWYFFQSLIVVTARDVVEDPDKWVICDQESKDGHSCLRLKGHLGFHVSGHQYPDVMDVTAIWI